MERAPLFVVDASVAVKWYVHESDREKALGLRADYARRRVDLLAPRLILYEVGNALRYHPNADENLSSDGVRALYGMGFTVEWSGNDAVQEAMRIAYSENITFYDAVYLALAEKEDAKVISADEKLIGRLREHRGRILSLRSLSA